MAVRSGNKKRNRRRRSLVLVVLALLALHADADRGRSVLFGLYSGWSAGLGQGFRWHNGGHYTDDYDLNFHLGAYAQYNLSESFGLQLNANYQGAVYRWNFSYPGMPPESGSDGTGFLSVGLNGVLGLKRVKNTQFYFLAGAGILEANSEEMNGFYLDFAGGMGMKLFLQRGSRSAVNIGGAFHHLLQPKRNYDDEKADFLRFQVGYEFCAK
jgi:hypothetical protein